MNKIKYIILLSIVLVSCNKSNVAKIDGTFSGLDKKTVFLELITTSNISMVDSAVTDEKGRFKFKVKIENKNPLFYNIRYNQQTITLLLSGGEHIDIKSLGNISNNYIVEGSSGSENIKKLSLIMNAARNSMDSLSMLFNNIPEAEQEKRLSVLNEYSKIFIQQKRDMIKFIMGNATSLSSIYALYQRMPNGENVFDGEDMLYFRLVSDSLSSRYPLSPHVLSLKKDVSHMENRRELNTMFNKARVSNVTFPDIDMPDMYGKKVRLSSIKDKVVLLDFWMAKNSQSRLDNAELIELYNKYSSQGFEVYQVSLDESKPLWVTTIQEQRIPWISVCDFNGVNTPAVHLYNITTLPANFLIDKQGNIVGKNIPKRALEDKLKELL